MCTYILRRVREMEIFNEKPNLLVVLVVIGFALILFLSGISAGKKIEEARWHAELKNKSDFIVTDSKKTVWVKWK